MVERLLKFGLCYIGYGVELTLFITIACHGRWKRLANLFIYLALLFTIDGAGRMYALYRFGQRSAAYSYFYWLSDDLLALAAFGLVCSFFRRACREKKELWHSIRFFLFWVFVLAILSTTFSLHRNLDHLHFNRFITEFEQNLYFSCLVLNTLLYISMQYIGNKDEELNLLVCGMGIQFAGPAASLAFSTLTPGGHPLSLFSYVDQLCFLGMLLVWAYAVVRVPKAAAIRLGSEQVQPLAEPAIRRAV